MPAPRQLFPHDAQGAGKAQRGRKLSDTDFFIRRATCAWPVPGRCLAIMWLSKAAALGHPIAREQMALLLAQRR